MSFKIDPKHEAGLAGLLMVAAAVGLGAIVAHDYCGRLPAGEAPEAYRNPVVRVRTTSRRIRKRLGSFVTLGDLDALYTDRIVNTQEEAKPDEGNRATADESSGGGEFRVTGIAWSTRQPMAFVNGRAVAPGDKVEGWTVSDITESRVTLTDEDGNEQQVGLYKKSGARAENEQPVGRNLNGGAGDPKAEPNAM